MWKTKFSDQILNRSKCRKCESSKGGITDNWVRDSYPYVSIKAGLIFFWIRSTSKTSHLQRRIGVETQKFWSLHRNSIAAKYPEDEIQIDLSCSSESTFSITTNLSFSEGLHRKPQIFIEQKRKIKCFVWLIKILIKGIFRKCFPKLIWLDILTHIAQKRQAQYCLFSKKNSIGSFKLVEYGRIEKSFLVLAPKPWWSKIFKIWHQIYFISFLLSNSYVTTGLNFSYKISTGSRRFLQPIKSEKLIVLILASKSSKCERNGWCRKDWFVLEMKRNFLSIYVLKIFQKPPYQRCYFCKWAGLKNQNFDARIKVAKKKIKLRKIKRCFCYHFISTHKHIIRHNDRLDLF